MATVVEVETIDDLCRVLATGTLGGVVRPEQVEVRPYGRDDRIGWVDTHVVTIDRNGVGYTNGPLPIAEIDRKFPRQ